MTSLKIMIVIEIEPDKIYGIFSHIPIQYPAIICITSTAYIKNKNILEKLTDSLSFFFNNFLSSKISLINSSPNIKKSLKII